MARVATATASVDHNSNRLGLLRKAGLCVRRTSTTASSVSSEIMNHEVWNVASFAWKTSSRTANVSRSKTELISPKTIMKRWISLMFQRCGRETRSGSTLSLEIAIDGTSERKLFSRICLAASGRNGSSGVASAMLTMLPKFALVVIEMYLSVLAKVRRPSSTPRAQHVQVAAEQDDVGALAGDVHRLLDRDADIGRMQGRRIVDAVAEIADRVAGPLQGADDPLLLLRIDFDEEIGARREMPQRLVLQRRELLAGEHRLRSRGRPPPPDAPSRSDCRR